MSKWNRFLSNWAVPVFIMISIAVMQFSIIMGLGMLLGMIAGILWQILVLLTNPGWSIQIPDITVTTTETPEGTDTVVTTKQPGEE